MSRALSSEELKAEMRSAAAMAVMTGSRLAYGRFMDLLWECSETFGWYTGAKRQALRELRVMAHQEAAR